MYFSNYKIYGKYAAGSAAFYSENGCLYDMTGEALFWASAGQIAHSGMSAVSSAPVVVPSSCTVVAYEGTFISETKSSVDVEHGTVREHNDHAAFTFLTICGWSFSSDENADNPEDFTMLQSTNGWYGNITTIKSPRRTGCKFGGWELTGGTVTMDTSGPDHTPHPHLTGNLTLTAKWDRILTKLTFDPNGGQGGEDATDKTVPYGHAMTVIRAEKPWRKGYVFTGWYDGNDSDSATQYYTKECTSARNWDQEVEEATMYAGWAKIKTISFDHSGADNSKELADEIFVTASKGSSGFWKDYACETVFERFDSVPIKTGHKLVGYYGADAVTEGDPIMYLNWEGKLTGYGVGRPQDGDTWTAEWKACTYKVSFDANKGEGGQSASVKATYGEQMPSISSAKPTRKGYAFTGWYDDVDYSEAIQYYDRDGASAKKWDKDEDATLYAGWAPIRTVTLDHNGADTPQPEQTEVYATASKGLVGYWSDAACTERLEKLVEAPTKTGYKLVGYYGKDAVDGGDPIMYLNGEGRLTGYGPARVEDRGTWTAKWEACRYKIRFDLNHLGFADPGGIDDVPATYDEKVTLPSPPPLYGYSFAGWDTKADGTGDRYEVGETEKAPNLAAEEGASAALYAQWVLVTDVELPVTAAPGVAFELGVPDGSIRVAGTQADPQGEAAGWLRSRMPVEMAVTGISCEPVVGAGGGATAAFWRDHATFADVTLRASDSASELSVAGGQSLAGSAGQPLLLVPAATGKEDGTLGELGELEVLYGLSLDRLFADVADGGAGVDIVQLAPQGMGSGFAVPEGLARLTFTVAVAEPRA